MSKKQFIWLLIALLLFAATGVSGVLMAERAQQQSLAAMETMFGSLFAAEEESTTYPDGPYVARVNVEGAITSAAAYGEGFDLDYTLRCIEDYMADEDNVGLLLYVNSPGGEMNASDTLYYKLMDYKTETGRPIYCYFDDYACSGGYYVAMPADEIYANRNSMCVNIGVYISTYNFSGLFEKAGVEEVIFRSSENKGIGMPGTPWTEEQKEIYQSIVDLHYQQFLEVVAEGRGMTTDEVKRRDDGREMLAVQALEAGFIDGICRLEEYEQMVLANFSEDTVIYEPYVEPDFMDELLGYLDSRLPKSDSQVWMDFAEKKSGMVVMAYAD
ncbi:MAG: S49 family peptidase [Ruminococcaceae bacterium]|nr:S49 family peptidase [Oscillospiraceae bacterium]